MFGWMKNKQAKKDASDKLLEAVVEREEAVKRAIHKMNLIVIDKRFMDIPVLEERRQS